MGYNQPVFRLACVAAIRRTVDDIRVIPSMGSRRKARISTKAPSQRFRLGSVLMISPSQLEVPWAT